jgi:hypothetical protein
MRFLNTTAGALLLLIAGCNTGSTGANAVPPPPTPAAVRTYTGTASVGDFLTISLDPNNKTIEYKDISNGDSGTATFTVQDNGTYAITDPTGNLIAADEVPNYTLLLEATKVGQAHDTKALITAVVSTPISLASSFNQTFNYMEFRTSQGGIEFGSAGMDSQGYITISSYWPFGDYYQSVPFHLGTFPASSIQQDPSGNFLKVGDVSGGVSYIFAAGDAFVADRPDGTFLGFDKTASKDFDPTFSGTYKTSLYQKLAASSSQGNVETGSSSFDNGSLTISANGQVTISDSKKQVVVQGTLTPVSDVYSLYNGGFLSLNDPCFGLFTFRVTTPTSQQDVFVGFEGQSVIFSSFSTTLPQDRSKTYDYFYGVALRK